MTDSRKPKRRWLQFSLRSLLVVMTVASLWLAIQANRAHQQRHAVGAIIALGGSVRYDYQKERPDVVNVFNMDAVPPAPKWIRTVLGDDYFRRVVLVSLRDTTATDDDLKVLRSLPTLETLDLSNTQITSAGLTHVGQLTSLKSLGLWKTGVGDSGLEHIRGLTQLWALILDDTNVTDEGLANIQGLTKLEEWLGLSGTKVTDDGLSHLYGLAKLKSLTLRGTAVTAAGIDELKQALPKADVAYDR